MRSLRSLRILSPNVSFMCISFLCTIWISRIFRLRYPIKYLSPVGSIHSPFCSLRPKSTQLLLFLGCNPLLSPGNDYGTPLQSCSLAVLNMFIFVRNKKSRFSTSISFITPSPTSIIQRLSPLFPCSLGCIQGCNFVCHEAETSPFYRVFSGYIEHI